jgi:thiol-disulfide isomerase/thioredoxin
MKQRCEKLTVEVSQTLAVFQDDSDQDEDYDYWYSSDFPERLMPVLSRIRREMPALKEVEFIFWFGNWIATISDWKEHLERLAQQWNAHIDQELRDVENESVNYEGSSMEYSEPIQGSNSRERESQNPVKTVDFDIFDETLNPDFNGSRRTEVLLQVMVQFNLFDYFDFNAGDGGSNWIQEWDRFADETENSHSALALAFSAIDLEWDGQGKGSFEGMEFEPKGWAHSHVNTLSTRERTDLLHRYYNLTTTCTPLYVEAGPGRE